MWPLTGDHRQPVERWQGTCTQRLPSLTFISARSPQQLNPPAGQREGQPPGAERRCKAGSGSKGQTQASSPPPFSFLFLSCLPKHLIPLSLCPVLARSSSPPPPLPRSSVAKGDPETRNKQRLFPSFFCFRSFKTLTTQSSTKYGKCSINISYYRLLPKDYFLKAGKITGIQKKMLATHVYVML